MLFRSTPVTFIVVATHGEHDEVALEEALRARAPYVGLVASGKRADSIRAYLGVRGIPKDALTSNPKGDGFKGGSVSWAETS